MTGTTILNYTQLRDAEARIRRFWHREFPDALRRAWETPDGRRIAFRVVGKAFGRPERGRPADVLSWIACVERAIAAENLLRSNR